jgi:hypothetical protein
MLDAARFRLLAKYRTPRVRVGRFVRCFIRGVVEVAGIRDGPIPWPVCKTARRHALIVFAGLACAIRRESAQAVGHWWGVRPLQVSKWRRPLGVGATTEGTSRLRSAYCEEPWFTAGRRKAQAKAADPERRAKIAAARKGKPRPRHVIEAMAAARRGKPHSEETRRRMSEAHRRRGTWPPAAGRPWTLAEDEAVCTLPAREAARRTGRSLGVVHSRRAAPAMPPGRGAVDGASGEVRATRRRFRRIVGESAPARRHGDCSGWMDCRLGNGVRNGRGRRPVSTAEVESHAGATSPPLRPRAGRR